MKLGITWFPPRAPHPIKAMLIVSFGPGLAGASAAYRFAPAQAVAAVASVVPRNSRRLVRFAEDIFVSFL
jgi:hypothetical protein